MSYEIRPEELRIGSYLYDRKENLCQAERIDEDEFYAPTIKGPLTYLPNKPIRITKEWLIKLGFTKNRKVYWTTQGCWHSYLFHGYVLNLELEGCNFVVTQVHFVHELQNLVYGLTKNELKIIK